MTPVKTNLFQYHIMQYEIQQLVTEHHIYYTCNTLCSQNWVCFKDFVQRLGGWEERATEAAMLGSYASLTDRFCEVKIHSSYFGTLES